MARTYELMAKSMVRRLSRKAAEAKRLGKVEKEVAIMELYEYLLQTYRNMSYLDGRRTVGDPLKMGKKWIPRN